MHAPLRVTVGERGAAAASVRQRLQFVGSEAGKLLALRQVRPRSAVAISFSLPTLNIDFLELFQRFHGQAHAAL